MMVAKSIVAVALAIVAVEALAQDVAPYCADLKRVASLASARDRFATIAGKPREGNFSDTVLPLSGWKDCSLYGAGMYTCDSPGLSSKTEAEKAQARATDSSDSCRSANGFVRKPRARNHSRISHCVPGSKPSARPIP